MDTDLKKTSAVSRRGVAMFVVLGAIVLVTMFGYVGITLAGKDQSLSGDLNDIKNRDEAAYSGLQIAINRFVAQPDTMVNVFNSFIQEGRTSHAAPTRSWVNLSSRSLNLVSSEPDWFSLATGNDQTAVKVRLLGIARSKDTTGSPDGNIDNDSIYVSLQCKARGRHGDEKTVQGTYLVHGLSVNFRQDTLYYTIPKHSLYVGGSYSAPNLQVGAQGDVYVASSSGSFLNTGAGMGVRGDLKWNSDLSINSSDMNIHGNLYIRGYLYSNGGALNVDKNAAIDSGFHTMNNANIWVKGNFWLGPTSRSASWGGTVRVDGNLVYGRPDLMFPARLYVGGSVWFPLGFTQTLSDSLKVGNRAYFGNNTASQDFTLSNNGFLKVDSSVIVSGGGTLTVPGGKVGDTIQVNRTLKLTSTSLQVGHIAQIDSLSGSLVIPSGGRRARGGAMNWVAPPTRYALGIDTALMKTSEADNPMDSVKVDSLHSPAVLAAAINLTSALIGDIHITAPRLNHLYDSLRGARALLNGYMVLRIRSNSDIIGTSGPAGGFTGKMIVIVEKDVSVGDWPSSATNNNIQVLLVRHGGKLSSFKWSGLFAGIIYWENPCDNISWNIPSNATLRGAILMGTTLTTASYGYTAAEVASCSSHSSSFTPNSGSVEIYRDAAVFEDIGRNLQGVLVPARTATGAIISTREMTFAWGLSPLLRLVHNRPYFEPLGVFR